uniref:Transposase domain-containing protein n=1 Tax=Bactrocera latifrons TaxID=174628 RepID=A0A0K8USQ8_BACLA
MQLWPILLRVVNVQNVSVFATGIYVGNSKPNSIDEFLNEFIEEVSDLQTNGFEFVCDAPAKAFLCGIPGHTSRHGCAKCNQVGRKKDGVLTYSTKAGVTVSNRDFLDRKYPNKHLSLFKENLSPLEKININMISQDPLDVMHLIDLGDMRKFILRVINNKSNYKFKKETKLYLSKKIVALSSYITREFVRKPRTVDEIANWKAIEFRMFLFYYGIYVLKDELPGDVYYEFLLLHCACRLLFCPKNYNSNIDVAGNMLKLFVENFAVVFGENSISYNVHSLLHISEDVKELGIPSSYSAYSFENHLQILKSYVKKPTQILQQIHNMMKHEEIVVAPKFTGFKIKNNIIVSFNFKEFLLSNKSPNSYCSVKPFQYIRIEEFKDINSKVIKGNRFLHLESYFAEPIDSYTMGICTADHILSSDIEEFSLDDVEYILMCIPSYSNITYLHVTFVYCNS